MTPVDAPYPGANDATVEQAIRTLAIQLYREQMYDRKDAEIALHDAKALILADISGLLLPDEK